LREAPAKGKKRRGEGVYKKTLLLQRRKFRGAKEKRAAGARLERTVVATPKRISLAIEVLTRPKGGASSPKREWGLATSLWGTRPPEVLKFLGGG